jgi:predicted membrane-bound spermidine synthase
MVAKYVKHYWRKFMEHVLWLARILGPFMTIIGLWMVLRTDDLLRVWNYAKNNIGFIYLGAILNLLVGFTILSTYHTWSFNLAVLLPILGWLLVLRGVLVFFAVDWVVRFTARFEPFHKAWAIIPLFFGICLSYIAFT